MERNQLHTHRSKINSDGDAEQRQPRIRPVGLIFLRPPKLLSTAVAVPWAQDEKRPGEALEVMNTSTILSDRSNVSNGPSNYGQFIVAQSHLHKMVRRKKTNEQAKPGLGCAPVILAWEAEAGGSGVQGQPWLCNKVKPAWVTGDPVCKQTTQTPH